MNASHWVDQLSQDVRFALRSLRRSPGMTTIILFTLSLSVATVTTFFGFVNTIIRPLPYKDADRTVLFWKLSKAPNYLIDQLLSQKVFERFTMYDEGNKFVVANGMTQRDYVTAIDSGFFPMLAPKTLLGALPSAADVEAGPNVAVLSERFWRRTLSADSAIVGQSLLVGGIPRRVMAVIADGFTIPDITDVWIPLAAADSADVNQIGRLARFAPGVTRQQAQRALNFVSARFLAANPSFTRRLPPVGMEAEMVNRNAGWGGVGGGQQLLVPLLAAAGCVLLIACMNIALLLLARGGRRRGEMIVRASLGASSWQLIRQQLVESLVLAVGSALIGTLLTIWGTKIVGALLLRPNAVWASWVHFGMDWRVAAFAIVVSLCTVMLFGVWPARAGSRFNLEQVLRSDASHGVVIGDPTRSARVPLVIQLTMSLTVFAGALMLWMTVRQVANEDRGYRPQGLFDVQISPDPARDSTPVAITLLMRQLGDALRAPGVQASLAGRLSDFGGPRSDGGVYLPGAERPVVPNTEYGYGATVISDDYFDVMGARLLAGRAFGPGDGAGAMPVAIVNHVFAMRAWGSDNVIGKTLIVGKARPDDLKKGKPAATPTLVTVVGVARDIRRSTNVNGQVSVVGKPDVYVSDRQANANGGSLMIRGATLSEATLQVLVGHKVSDLGRTFPVTPYDMKTRVDLESRETRILALITSMFAGACLVLALMGVYGIVAFGVEQRTRELGVRLALGAQTSDVIRAVMGRGVQLIGISLLFGLGVSVIALKVLAGFLAGTVVANLATSTAVAVIFGVVAMVASYLPARKAARLDPVVALRN